MAHEWRLTLDTLHAVLRRIGDPNVLPLLHVMLIFFWQLSRTPQGAVFLERSLEFGLLCDYLNGLEDPAEHTPQLPYLNFPTSLQTQEQPLPEDFILRGQIYASGVYPRSWFESASTIDMDERSIEQPLVMTKIRTVRVKWLAAKIALIRAKLTSPEINRRRRWLNWDSRTGKFSVVERSTVADQFAHHRQAQVSPPS